MKQLITILLILISLTSFGQGGTKFTVKGNGSGGSNVGDSVKKNTDTLVVHRAGIGANTTALKYTAKVYNILAFGADSTGVSDATAAIRLAIAAASYSGGTVFIPHGTYKVTDSIVITANNVQFLGEGESSKILASGDYGNIFSCHPVATPTTQYGGIQGIQFNNFYIESSTTRTTGAAIYAKYSYNIIVSNMRIGSPDWKGDNSVTMRIYDAVYLQYESAAIVTGSQLYPTHYGVYLSGQSIGTGAVALFIWDGLITGNCNIWGKRNAGAFVTGSVGVYIAGGLGGVQIEQSNISWFENGVKSSGTNRELFIGHAFAADDCGGAGIYIKDTLNIFQMTGGWAAGNARGAQTPAYNLYVDSLTKSNDGFDSTAVPRINITGGTIYASGANGVYIGSGRVTMSNVSIYGNTTVANSLIFGGNVKAISIVGGRCPVITSYIIPPILKGVMGLSDNTPTYATNSTSGNVLNITNTSTGASTGASIQFNNSLYAGSLGIQSAGYTPTGSILPNTMLVNAVTYGGLLLNAWAGTFRISTTSSYTERLRIDSTGALGLGTTTPHAIFDIQNKFRVNTGSAATGELVAGTSIDTYSGENLIFIASPAAPSTKTTQFGFWNGGSWKSMLEWSNVASGAATLLIGKTSGNVAIGATSAAASAVLDVNSTTQGFLPPRMTATQASAISSPAEGLMVYVTNTNGTFTAKGWWGYDGAAWQKLNN